MPENTHFGYKTVPEDEKSLLVRKVFSSVATRYDVMNDLMSAGLHHLWKDAMVALLPSTGKLLDVAGGTGDIAARYLKKTHAATPVTICDINQEMLEAGRDRAIDRNQLHAIEWICGDAESLPFEDKTFDAYSIAFGIRNVTHIDKALGEAYRVLKPGGKFVCLEFSHVTVPLLASIYDQYSFHLIPKIGKLVTGDANAYQYLVESIRQFPAQADFANMIRQAGFSNSGYRNMHAGIVALHYGWRT
jgi:demethylmenaquinone methyltransferase/2-methoxy-6-polyprenyl-1,4-benzoquinol methylase